MGKPDLVFLKLKIAIFVHGCFWHQHGCKNSTLPKTNIDFWEKKLRSNLERDKDVRKKLSDEGWRSITVWECEIEKDLVKEGNKIRKLLNN